MNDVKVVGLGAVGHVAAKTVANTLAIARSKRKLVLVDGGVYIDQTDEHFLGKGFKADLLAREIRLTYPCVTVEPLHYFVGPVGDTRSVSAKSLMKDGDSVLVAVDNHKTRKLISDSAAGIPNITVISGANDGEHTGIIQVYVRRYGKDCCPPLTAGHPYIANPTDESPTDMLAAQADCETRIRSGQQLMGTVVLCAAYMVAAYLAIEELDSCKVFDLPYVDLYLNSLNGKTRTELYGLPKRTAR